MSKFYARKQKQGKHYKNTAGLWSFRAKESGDDATRMCPEMRVEAKATYLPQMLIYWRQGRELAINWEIDVRQVQ